MRFNRLVVSFLGLLIIQMVMLPVAWAGIFSIKQEIAIGEGVARQIERQYPLTDDSLLQERVARIGARLAAVSEREGIVYTFKVLDVEDVNAMAAPGGFIYVFRGLTELMRTDDEIAGILAHEVSHVVKRHSMAQMEKNLGMTLLMGIAFGGEVLPAQMVALNAIAAGYSRSDERQADKLGYELLVKAGYNPYGSLVGLMKLYELNPQQKSDLFSDHPEAAARIHLMKQYLAEDQVQIMARRKEADGSAEVVDGAWTLPAFKVASNGTDPIYRAYLTAGNLERLVNLPDYSSDRYILDSDGLNITIYYDAWEVLTLTPEDAAAEEIPLDALVGRYLESLQGWRSARGM